ncbi:S8 family serine peptidase [Actinophytocola sp. NPDC049390]|uniref:S8 family serine peptidase n=1 Tax=Actinophytocola sp. NPDC049390 TaxID=3363894 RepID=UPI0037999C8E
MTMNHPPRRTPRVTAALSAAGLMLSLLVVSPPTAGAAAEPDTKPAADKIAPDLTEKFAAAPGEAQDFWITFTAEADTAAARDVRSWDSRGALVVDRLRATAKNSQAATIARLKKEKVEYTSVWITNAVRVEDGSLGLAHVLAADPGVDRILPPQEYEPPAPVSSELSENRVGVNAEAEPEWGVKNIRADQVWRDYGVRGDGVVIGSIDTGAQFDHPALAGSYRGYHDDGTFSHDYNWFDATGASDFPTDDNGHGTHTIGTMVGDDGAANRIGVAPGATWISANGCASCSDTNLIASAQWMLAPTKVDGTAPDPGKRPDIINNSWGTRVPSNDPFMEDIQQAWADAGIFGVWSNGNNGPNCATSGSPGSRTINYSVGAYDVNNAIAPFSSRGAGQDGEIKPNISAPGVNVRSSVPGGRYAIYNGTSMAAPHVAGAIALLWAADPTLAGDVAGTRQLLDSTAVDTADAQCGGTAEDNNVYGEGRLDAIALLEGTNQGSLGTLTGTVASTSGAAVPGATIRLTAGSTVRSSRSDDTGAFTLRIPAGEYSAAVTAFGFEEATETVTIIAGGTATLAVSLVALPGYTISGRVVDENTGVALPNATVSVAGSVYSAVTDLDGNYAIENVPAPRTHLVTIDAGICGDRKVFRSVELVDADVSLGPVVVPRRAVDGRTGNQIGTPYGYDCVVEKRTWTPGTDPVELTPNPDARSTVGAELTLPFEFRYQGYPMTKVEVKNQTTGLTELGFCVDEPRWHAIRADDNCPPTPRIQLDTELWRLEGSEVRTATTGTAPHRAFTIEFHNFVVATTTSRIDLAVVLYEGGDITIGADRVDPEVAAAMYGGAIVFMTGSSGSPTTMACCTHDYLQPSNAGKWPWRTNDTQMRIDLPDAGLVQGTVTDAATRKPIAGASVDIVDGHGRLRWRYRTDSLGRYRAEIFTGQRYTVSAIKPGGYPTRSATATAGITAAQTSATANVSLTSASPTVKTVQTSAGSTTFQLGNKSKEQYDWQAAIRNPVDTAAPATQTGRVNIPFGMYSMAIEEADNSWWVSLAKLDGTHKIAEYTTGGVATGRTIPTEEIVRSLGVDPRTVDVRDLAFVDALEEICFVFNKNVNGIVCAKAATGELARMIRFDVPQGGGVNGLAYDEDTDRFFVELNPGVNTRRALGTEILTVAGWRSAAPGTVRNRCVMYGVDGIGLAYQPGSGSLWKTTPGALATPPYLVRVDPRSCIELATHRLAAGTPQLLRGTDIRDDGTLLSSGFAAEAVLAHATGDDLLASAPWLSLSQTSGVQDRRATSITATLDAGLLPPGVTGHVDVVIRGNGGEERELTVPVQVP